MMHEEEDAGFEINQIIKHVLPSQSGTGSADNDDDGLNTSNDDDDNIGEVSAFGIVSRSGGGGLLTSWSKNQEEEGGGGCHRSQCIPICCGIGCWIGLEEFKVDECLDGNCDDDGAVYGPTDRSGLGGGCIWHQR